uniref:Gon-4 like b n=1 Tax=Myripristis murdjan TaxID=586833 RepID=A0A667ZK47_9TELE
MFTLNHTASLPPLAKAPADQQPVGFLAHVPGASSQVITPLAEVPAKQTQMTPLPPTPQTLPTFAVCPGSAHSARGATSQSLSILTIVPPISSRRAPTFTKQPDRHHTVPPPAPPPSSQTVPDQPAGGGSSATMKPDHFLVQSRDSQHALGLRQSSRSAENRVGGGEELMEELESLSSASTLSPLSSPGGRSQEEEEENRKWSVGYVAMTNGGEEEQEAGGTGAGDGDLGGAGDGGGGGEGGGAGDRDQDGEGDENGERDEAQSNGERDDDGEKDGDGDQDRQGEEEEEEDFDDLTQDEDEEEAMSSASEESVLSVPELQETMKQLTWLASEGRLCGDADSEEDHSPASPTSPGSQEDNSEEEEEGPAKGEESGEGRSAKMTDEEMPPGEGTPRSGGKGPGRGRARPPRGLRRSRQERNSKDSSKLLLLYDDNILDNDPHRESKDIAFAQSYLTRVREALQDVPGKVEEFLALLYESERVDEGRDVVALFRRLHGILGDRTDLLRDFAAFLHPEQALECGLFEEQQAFERSRRFLRQLEISFGENPSHYQKIIKALQGGADLSPASIHELKAQMSVLLKGHTHLQGEFWVFFDELRPPPARPGQFEEAHWPDEGGGSDGGEVIISGSGGGASSGFEEVTLPELEEEEEGHKIQPMASRPDDMAPQIITEWSKVLFPDEGKFCISFGNQGRVERHRIQVT